MIRRPPRSTLFPYTTLFRSAAAKPDLRTYVKEQARRMFVGAEIIEESKDELIVQCLSSYGDLPAPKRSEEHTSELQSRPHLVCRLLLEKKHKNDDTVSMQNN